MVVERKPRRRNPKKASPVTEGHVPETQAKEEKPVDAKAETKPAKKEKLVRKRLTREGSLRILFVALLIVGLCFFLQYFITLNMVFGAPGVFLIAGGAIGLKYYWGKGDAVTEHHGKVPQKQVNSLNLYKDAILFEDVPDAKGYLYECLNDHRKYYVNFIPEESIAVKKQLSPFILPDQQYYDPTVFAERVLSLPAHRRIFRRREKMGQVIKTALLVLTILILWILILTTTGK